MHHSSWPALLAAVLTAACGQGRRADSPPLTAEHAAAISDSVRAFAQSVARDVSDRGPAAWRSHFAETPAFFMAAEGHLVFASSDAAIRGISDLTRAITRIHLRWGDTLRVDPLFPGMAVLATPWEEVRVDSGGRSVEEAGYFTAVAEHEPGGWRFRDAHWSVAGPPPRVR